MISYWLYLLLVAGAYHIIYYEELVTRFIYTDLDIAVSDYWCITHLGSSTAGSRSAFNIVASLALLYAYFGPYFPGFAEHQGFSVERISTFMFLGSEAILGIPIAISSTFIFLFLFFGVVLRYTGVSQFFNNLAFAITGRMVGGPGESGSCGQCFPRYGYWELSGQHSWLR